MTRNTLVLFSFAILAFACVIQVTTKEEYHFHVLVKINLMATFNLAEFLEERIKQTIDKEQITCTNYENFCEKSNEQFQTSNEPNQVSANQMAIQLCKIILEAHVCFNVTKIATNDGLGSVTYILIPTPAPTTTIVPDNVIPTKAKSKQNHGGRRPGHDHGRDHGNKPKHKCKKTSTTVQPEETTYNFLRGILYTGTEEPNHSKQDD